MSTLDEIRYISRIFKIYVLDIIFSSYLDEKHNSIVGEGRCIRWCAATTHFKQSKLIWICRKILWIRVHSLSSSYIFFGCSACVFVLCVFVQAFQSVISMRSEQAFGEDNGHHFSALWISLLCFCHRFMSSLNMFGCFFSFIFTAFEQEQGQGLSIKKHMEQISSAYGLRKALNCCMTPNPAGTVWLHSWIYKKDNSNQ